MSSPFLKRHASFHSPRQVPLPSPSRERDQPFFEPADDEHTEQPSSWIDRLSSASLPSQNQIPYYALPHAKGCPPLVQSTSDSSIASTSSGSSSGDSMSCPTSSSASSSPGLPSPTDSQPPHRPPLSHTHTLKSPIPSLASKPSSPPSSPRPQSPRPRPTSPQPFRAPQPPQRQALQQQPQQPYYPTAMRSCSTRPLSSSSSCTNSSASPSLNLPGYTPAYPAAPVSASLSYNSYQLPEAPTILDDPPPRSSHQYFPQQQEARPAYTAFLSSTPQPPADSWIRIHTLPQEYTLYVRLQGFTREGITLATKRGRILHLVADRWDDGVTGAQDQGRREGGHFERRIAFGHDADLVHVRAEFDGEMLRVYVPRRGSAVVASSTNGCAGRGAAIAYSRA